MVYKILQINDILIRKQDNKLSQVFVEQITKTHAIFNNKERVYVKFKDSDRPLAWKETRQQMWSITYHLPTKELNLELERQKLIDTIISLSEEMLEEIKTVLPTLTDEQLHQIINYYQLFLFKEKEEH